MIKSETFMIRLGDESNDFGSYRHFGRVSMRGKMDKRLLKVFTCFISKFSLIFKSFPEKNQNFSCEILIMNYNLNFER